MSESVAQYLHRMLPKEQYEELVAVSRNWTIPLFFRNPDTGAVECGHTPEIDPDEAEAFLDAVCHACEVLTGSGLSFPGDPAFDAESDESGSISVTYRFEPDQEAWFEAFRTILKDLGTKDEGIDAQFQKYPWGFHVVVHLQFANDFDYKAKKDSIDWALQVARLRTDPSPLRGSKI